MTTNESAQSLQTSKQGLGARSAARFALGAGAVFLALLAVLHLLRPELDPSWAPISLYGRGPHGWLMGVAFLAWSASGAGLFVALRSRVASRAGRIGLGFLVVGASGPLLAGIFPMDPLDIRPDAMSTGGMLHSLGAVLSDGIPIAAALLAWSLPRHDARWARAPLAAAAAAAWLAAVVLTVSMVALLPEGGQLGPAVPVGWQGRATALAYVACLMTFGFQAARLEAA